MFAEASGLRVRNGPHGSEQIATLFLHLVITSRFNEQSKAEGKCKFMVVGRVLRGHAPFEGVLGVDTTTADSW